MDPLLRQLEDELNSSLRGLNAAQTQLHPRQDSSRWNIYQIVQHLLLTYSSTSSSIEDRIAKGIPTRTRPTTSQLIARFFVIDLGLLPGRREAPSMVSPPAEPPDPIPDGAALASTASASLIRMNSLLEKAESIFHTTPCQSHFALGPLNASQWRRFHLAHGRHHIRQITAIRREYCF